MADQNELATEDEIDSQSEVEDINQNQANNQEVEDKFIVLRGKYKYGGRNKVYGLLELIAQKSDTKFKYVDLGSSSNQEIDNLFLDFNDPKFVEILKQVKAKGDKQSQEIIKELRSGLAVSQVVEAVEKDELDKIKKIIQEKIEDEFQEGIQIELELSFVTLDKLREIYPQRFKQDDESSSESGEIDLEEDNSDNLSDFGEKSFDLDIDIKLKCDAVISAISGKLITSFDIGDEMLVRITDERDLTGELENKIRISNGLGVGTIKSIDYKEGVERYKVLVKLGDKIYGRLMVGPKVMLSYPEPQGNNIVDEANDLNDENLALDSGLIFAIIGLVLIVSMLLLMYL